MLQLSQIDRSIPIQRSAPVTRSGFPFSEFIFNLPRNLMASGEKEGGDKKAVERKAESGGCRDRARVVRCNFREIIDRIEIMKRPCQS